jgi:polar amino acid transport system substrate-binding protein
MKSEQMVKMCLMVIAGIMTVYLSAYAQEEQLAANTDTKTVVLAAEDGWPPFSGPNAEGLAEDIITASYKAVGYKVKYISVPFARAEHMALKGKKVDGFFTTLINPAYVKKSIFPKNPIAMNEDSFFALNDRDIPYKDLMSLKGLKVGVVNEYPYSEDFENANFFKKDVAPSSKSNIRKLIAKRIDVLIEDKLVMSQLLKEMKLQDKVKLIGVQAVNPLYICFAINRPIIKTYAEKFDEGIEMIKKNGTYQKIMNQYR